MDYVPERWSPLDVTGRWKLIAHSQSLSGHAKISRMQMLQSLGIENFKKLFPYYPVDAPVMVPMGELAGERSITNLNELFEKAYSEIGFLNGTGSNNWAVDGTPPPVLEIIILDPAKQNKSTIKSFTIFFILAG